MAHLELFYGEQLCQILKSISKRKSYTSDKAARILVRTEAERTDGKRQKNYSAAYRRKIKISSRLSVHGCMHMLTSLPNDTF